MNKSNKSITDKGFTLMDNFRENINSYIGNMTLSELSERAGIPFSTLRGMLYENSSDCNLSNAVKLAKVFSISVDELFGANTMEERTTDCLNTCRELPENSRYLISWFIQHQKTLNNRKENHKSVSIMKPKYKNGHLVPSNDFSRLILMIFPTILRQKYFWESKLIVKILCPIILRMISFCLRTTENHTKQKSAFFFITGK